MTETVALIDYDAGNLRSASNALIEAARRAGVEIDLQITSDPDLVARADRIVLPGVGAFAACMRALEAVDGLIDAMAQTALERARPFLGVCVGLQLLAETGNEHGARAGLGWIKGEVDALRPDDPALKLPHMGWNLVTPTRAHPVLDALGENAFVYFVHSYALRPADPQDAALACDYGGPFTAAAARDTVLGVQFHPEKSQARGLALLSAFLKWSP